MSHYYQVLELGEKVGEKIGYEVRSLTVLLVQEQTNGTFYKRILGDRLLLEMTVLVAVRYNKLFDLIDRKMQQLFEGGIFHRFNKKVQRFLDIERFRKHTEPFAVLTFDELEAGFVICFASLLFAVAAFALEWLVVLNYYCLVKWIFDAFFRIQEDVIKGQSENLKLKMAMWEKIFNERQNQIQAKTRQAMWKNILKQYLSQRSATKTSNENLISESDGNLEKLISGVLET